MRPEPDLPSGAIAVPVIGLVIGLITWFLGFGIVWVLLAFFVFGPALGVGIVAVLSLCARSGPRRKGRDRPDRGIELKGRVADGTDE